MNGTLVVIIVAVIVIIAAIVVIVVMLNSMKNMSQMLKSSQQQFKNDTMEQIRLYQNSNTDQMVMYQTANTEQIRLLQSSNVEQTRLLTEANEKKLEEMRRTLNEGLEAVRSETDRKLAEIKGTVDEKLQTTLEKRITESFKSVSEQLEQVYKGLGEMQSLASDVGGLKKVLAGVKTRGILGEVQLAAILEEILTTAQYDTNVATVPGSSERVEFAVRLPGGEEGSVVYLPIDSKFPGERYAQLRDAQDAGDKDQIEAAYKALETVIRLEAKDIHEKYVAPPYTTNFAIMFLPFEGLYSEVVNRGLVEELQRKWQINIAGPSTMAALLNSLQMGFRTLAIQKRSNEVWQVLASVKTEFETFEGALNKMKTHLNQTSDDLEKLIGTRTRAMQRKLRQVQTFEDDPVMRLFGQDDEEYGLEEAGDDGK